MPATLVALPHTLLLHCPLDCVLLLTGVQLLLLLPLLLSQMSVTGQGALLVRLALVQAWSTPVCACKRVYVCICVCEP